MLACLGNVLGSPENWVEVKRFTGSGSQSYTTEFFTCTHVEWRIRWSYTPDPSYPQYSSFSFVTYPEGEDALYTDFIMKTGSSDTSGASYIHNKKGTFYSKVGIANTAGYTVIIEQDVDSIPEYATLLVIPLASVSLLLAVVLHRKARAQVGKA